MTRNRAIAVVSAVLALTFAFNTPARAQDPAAEDPQLEAGDDRASRRSKAPAEIEQSVEGYLIAHMDVLEDADAAGKGTAAAVTSTVHFGYNVLYGGRTGDVILTSTGWNFGTSLPRSIQVQARQGSNDPNTGYPDQFSIQVLSTTSTSIRVRIRRLDDGTGSSGWGQDLRLDFMVTP